MNQPCWKLATGGNREQKSSRVLGGSHTQGWGKGNKTLPVVQTLKLARHMAAPLPSTLLMGPLHRSFPLGSWVLHF